MVFTREGIDRYNGKEFKTIQTNGRQKKKSTLYWIWTGYTSTRKVYYEIGKKEKYTDDKAHDTFELVQTPLENKTCRHSAGYIDNSHIIYGCVKEKVSIYDTKSQDTTK